MEHKVVQVDWFITNNTRKLYKAEYTHERKIGKIARFQRELLGGKGKKLTLALGKNRMWINRILNAVQNEEKYNIILS